MKSNKQRSRSRRKNRRHESTLEFEKLEKRQLFAADLLGTTTLASSIGAADSVHTAKTIHQVQHDSQLQSQVDTNDDKQPSADALIQRIVNGTQTSGYEAVGIVNGQCSGTLIAPNAVLTAAHCVEGMGDTEGTFTVGGKTYSTTKMTIHPDYQSSKDVDLAVMILSENVTGVTPMDINRVTPQVGEVLTLVGFGATGNGNSGHNGDFGVKHEGKTPIDEVTATHVNWNFDNNNESNTAPGDSGGPAFLNQNGKLVIAGVTSGGTRDDAAIGDYSFDIRVDAFADWIDSLVDTTGSGGGNTGGGNTGGGNNGGGTQNGNGTTFTSSQTVNISSNQTSTVSTSVDASGLSGKVTDVNVTFDIAHTWDSDLEVTLISPEGERIQLFDQVGDDGDNFSGTTLDGQASQSIANANAPFNGTFKPTGDLAAFNGSDPNGRWTLEVTDHYEEDGGRINSFAVTIETDGSDSNPGDGSTGNGGDPDGGSNDALATLAQELDSQHELNFAGDYYENAGGLGEKWMIGKNGWYFITPDGGLHQGRNSKLIGQFDASYHANPKKLHAAGDATLAAQLDAELGLKSGGNYFTNAGGLNEKWMAGNDGWYFIMPDGSLFKGRTGQFIAQLDADYHTNPALLHDASDRSLRSANLMGDSISGAGKDLDSKEESSEVHQDENSVDAYFASFYEDGEDCHWA